jgi:hypothetical protein
MALKPENVELFNKIEAGLKLAIRKLYEQKAANNETAVISINGQIKRIPAKDLIKGYKKD